jgi:hypothetical protein
LLFIQTKVSEQKGKHTFGINIEFAIVWAKVEN